MLAVMHAHERRVPQTVTEHAHAIDEASEYARLKGR